MHERINEWVAIAAFPLAIIASVGGGIALMNRGNSPEAVTGWIIFASYLGVALLERLFPLHPEWSRSHGDVRTDIALAVTNGVVNLGAQPLVLAGSGDGRGQTVHQGIMAGQSGPTNGPWWCRFFPR